MKIEELKNMTLEELKAISRPLEVGEVIQEGDWFEVCSSVEFSASTIGEKFAVHHKQRYRPIEAPTDKPADEIKLGWYRHSDGWFFELLGFRHPSNVYRHKCIGYRYDGAACCFSSDALANEFTYLGTTLPEPGEWADPGDVKLSELPMRARFRDCDSDGWLENESLYGFQFDQDEPFIGSENGWRQCQVWRPSK